MASALDLALAYVEKGWHVFPCKPKSKEPATSDGFYSATRDPERVRKWFTPRDNWPDFNIGIRTGDASDLVVLDVDAKSGGLESLATLVAQHGELCTYTVRTAGGGLHYYWKRGDTPRGNRTGVRPGIDVRADGGYVVAPPSTNEAGAGYCIAEPAAPQDIPPWLSTLLEQKPPASPVDPDASGLVPDGMRNAYLMKLGGQLRRTGISGDTLYDALMTENDARCVPPKSEREVRAVVQWLMKKEPGASVLASLGEASPDTVPGDASGLVIKASDLAEPLFAYLEDKDRVKGEPTLISGLDELLGGGKRLGEVTCWHAEAKTGKNTLWHKQMHLWLTRPSLEPVPMAYASRELSPAEEVLPDLLSVHFKKNARLSDVPREAYKEALDSWPLYFASGYGHFPFEELERWVLECIGLGVRFFWFDHLHYMIEDPEEHKLASKLIKLIKTVAKKHSVHVDIIIQPNKLQDGQKLSLGSIKGGAAMGQAIDNLIILEREKGQQNVMKLSLEACRSKLGKRGSIYLEYNPETTDFREMEKAVISAPCEPDEDDTPNPASTARRLYGKVLHDA